MKFFKIDKQNWSRGIDTLRNSYRIMGPVKEDAFHSFKELAADEAPDLSFQNTRLSAKSLIHPQSQLMFTYSLDENETDHHVLQEVKPDEGPVAIIGIRPCDADAFLLVRRNFDTPEHKDLYWVKTYEKTIFVGLACNQPCLTCFCSSAGSGPFSTAGVDVLLADMADQYLIQSFTAKGDAFLATADWNTEIPQDQALKEIEILKTAAESKMTSRISTDRLKEKDTLALYDAPFWEDVAFACINCGTCTYLCPTCWCFDIQDENFGKAGVRMRNWDSCMYPLFTLHGSGHNPHGLKMQRVRQRFMHKLKYYPDKYENGIQCVGCGRCVQFCPVNIDIRSVCERMNRFQSSDTDAQQAT